MLEDPVVVAQRAVDILDLITPPTPWHARRVAEARRIVQSLQRALRAAGGVGWSRRKLLICKLMILMFYFAHDLYACLETQQRSGSQRLSPGGNVQLPLSPCEVYEGLEVLGLAQEFANKI
jgi:hypothetical protein